MVSRFRPDPSHAVQANRLIVPFRRRAPRIIGTVTMWAVAALVVLPLILVVLTSFKPDVEIRTYPPNLVPQHPTLQNYVQLFQIFPFARQFGNSLGVSVASAILTIAIAAPAAYAMTRFKSLAVDSVSLVGLVAFMLPGILIAVPVFRVVYLVHGLDSPPVLTALYTLFLLPLAVWQLRSYFAGISREVEDAALVDGATRFQAFYLVVLPQAVPGLLGTAALTFCLAWNEYLFASLILFTPDNETLSVGMAHTLVGSYGIYSWGILLAGASLMTVPVLVAFLYVQRRLVGGLSAGSVKG